MDQGPREFQRRNGRRELQTLTELQTAAISPQRVEVHRTALGSDRVGRSTAPLSVARIVTNSVYLGVQLQMSATDPIHAKEAEQTFTAVSLLKFSLGGVAYIY